MGALALWANLAGAQGASVGDSSLTIVADMVGTVSFAWQRCGTADLSAGELVAFER